MKLGLKERIIKWGTAFIVVSIIVGSVPVVYPKFQVLNGLRRQQAELDRKIAEKQREIARYAEYQRRFRADPDFVEHIARQNHRVYPGELVFLLESEK